MQVTTIPTNEHVSLVPGRRRLEAVLNFRRVSDKSREVLTSQVLVAARKHYCNYYYYIILSPSLRALFESRLSGNETDYCSEGFVPMIAAQL
jgi:hypothetical protein